MRSQDTCLPFTIILFAGVASNIVFTYILSLVRESALVFLPDPAFSSRPIHLVYIYCAPRYLQVSTYGIPGTYVCMRGLWGVETLVAWISLGTYSVVVSNPHSLPIDVCVCWEGKNIPATELNNRTRYDVACFHHVLATGTVPKHVTNMNQLIVNILLSFQVCCQVGM